MKIERFGGFYVVCYILIGMVKLSIVFIRGINIVLKIYML